MRAVSGVCACVLMALVALAGVGCTEVHTLPVIDFAMRKQQPDDGAAPTDLNRSSASSVDMTSSPLPTDLTSQ